MLDSAQSPSKLVRNLRIVISQKKRRLMIDKEIHFKLQKYKKIFKRDIYIKPNVIDSQNFHIAKRYNFDQIQENLKIKCPELYSFFVLLRNYNENKNLLNFIYNVQNLKIEKKPPQRKIKAQYKARINTIIMYGNDINTLFHELLHVSSTNNNTNPAIKKSGFNITYYCADILRENGIQSNVIRIGRGINEGYTELLNRRIFPYESKSYIELQKIAELIEMFYQNKEDMMTDYFNGNLNGLIYELKNYGTYNEIINLLIDIDELLYTKTLKKINSFQVKRKLLTMYSRRKTKSEIRKFKQKMMK